MEKLHIKYIEDYIARWDSAEENNEPLDRLIDELETFCNKNNYEHLSADELLHELLY